MYDFMCFRNDFKKMMKVGLQSCKIQVHSCCGPVWQFVQPIRLYFNYLSLHYNSSRSFPDSSCRFSSRCRASCSFSLASSSFNNLLKFFAKEGTFRRASSVVGFFSKAAYKPACLTFSFWLYSPQTSLSATHLLKLMALTGLL